MFLRIIEYSSLGIVAIAQVGEPVGGTLVTRFGALGLVAFMVVQNYRQMHAMAKLLDRRADQFATLTAESTAAMNRLTTCLEKQEK